MAHEWKNKVVFITGAATGIGAHVVRVLMDEDVKQVCILDIAEVHFQNELNAKYGKDKVKYIKGDVTNEAQLVGTLETIYGENGGIDVVINNAGILNDQKFKKSVEINVSALIICTLKALELMRKDRGGKGGTIINITSVAALQQIPMLPVYWATKAAVLQFSNCLGMEPWYSRTGVRVLAVCFGGTDTPLVSGNIQSFDKDFEPEVVNYVRTSWLQKPESAAKGIVDIYKKGESGSTWVSKRDEPVEEITQTIQKAYELMSQHI